MTGDPLFGSPTTDHPPSPPPVPPVPPASPAPPVSPASPVPAVGQACPTCGEAVLPGDQFCEACGTDLPAAIADAEPPPDAPAPRPQEGAGLEASVDADLGPTFHHCGGTFVDGWCDTCGDREPAPGDHVELDLGVAGAVTDKGHRHHHNEDGFALEVLDDGTVVGVVCDGVSSTVNPEQASLAASTAAAEVLRDAPTDFVAAHAAALAAVRAVAWAPAPRRGAPSCTFLAGTVVGGRVHVANMGDCRAYWLPTIGRSTVLTLDDSWAHAQVQAGAMTMEQAQADRRAHVITRWLGHDANDDWQPRESVPVLGPGLLVLCSDGLWNYLERPDDLAEVVEAIGPTAGPAELARELVTYALDSGGHDNVTVLCIPVPPPEATE